MRKKSLLIVGLVIATAVALIFTMFLQMTPSPEPTYANFSRLRSGMTKDEVEAVLGLPHFADFHEGILIRLDYVTTEDDTIRVYFEPDGRVRDCGWNGWEDGRNAWERLRDRLPWIAKPPSHVFPEDVR